MARSRSTRVETVSDALTEMLVAHGVRYIFANLGTDHSPLIESWAKYRRLRAPMPEVVICPHEMVALSAAHAYAQVTGRPQAVLVHVDVGTLNLGGSIHNANRGRVPVLILAGLAPMTLEGERPGSRDNVVHFLQDVYDQAGIVREYTRWEYQLRTSANVDDVVQRAFRMALTDPKGPVYLLLPREVLEEPVRNFAPGPVARYAPPAPIMPDPAALDDAAAILAKARRPLIITSYLGRSADAVRGLVRLAHTAGAPVVEAAPTFMNFPTDHPLHQGFNAAALLPEADVILLLDTDVPWIPLELRPHPRATIVHLDIDPVKSDMPLWCYPTDLVMQGDTGVALPALASRLRVHLGAAGRARAAARATRLARAHARQRARWRADALAQHDAPPISPAYLAHCIGEAIGPDTIVVNETITNALYVWQYAARTRPGTLFGCGGSGIGWGGGAALGATLAAPDREVVLTVGDGSWLIGVPEAFYWCMARYAAPSLTVIFNNGGWRATKYATLRLHPRGHAKAQDEYWSSFEPMPDYAMVAAGVGCYAETVREPGTLRQALKNGLAEVRAGRAAVLDVHLPHL